MEEQRVRISDSAQELGLSTATVSNVIHGKTKKIKVFLPENFTFRGKVIIIIKMDNYGYYK